MSDESQIQELVQRFVNGLNGNDVKGMASIFAEDADFTNVFGHHASGRAEIGAFHAPLFADPPLPGVPSFLGARLEAVDTRIRFVRPDVATVDVKWRQTGALAPNREPWGTRMGLASWVATRDNGVWSVATMHNLELPA